MSEFQYTMRDCAHTFGMRIEFICDVLLGIEPTSMDAPDTLPGGSTWALDCAGERVTTQRTTYRDGWRE